MFLRLLLEVRATPQLFFTMWPFLLDFLQTFPYGKPIFVGSVIHQVSESLKWSHLMTELEFSSTFANTSLIGFSIVILEILEPGTLNVLLNQNVIRRNQVLVPFHGDILDLLTPHLRLDSRLYLYKTEGLQIDLIQSYSLHQHLVTQQIGTWTKFSGLIVEKKFASIKYRNDFQGLPIITGSLPNTPFAIYSPSNPPTGYFEEIIQILAAKMNFTHETQFSADGKWGNMDDQGQWNGLIKGLILHDFDVVIGGLSYTEERSLVIQYSDIVHLNYFSLIFPPPKGKCIIRVINRLKQKIEEG